VRRGFVALFGISAAAHGALLLAAGGPPRAPGTPKDSAEVLIDVAATVAASAQPPVAAGAIVASASPKAAGRPGASSEVATRSMPHETPGLASARPGAPSVTPADGAMPRFTIALGASPDADSAGTRGATPAGALAADEPVSEALVDTKARLIFGLSPAYPDAARERAAEGDVLLDLVIDAGGAVESARVVRGVDPSLDVAALQAAQRFRFDPARRAGRTVAVRMRWSVQFRLR
jgi:TonB family protein